MPTVRSVIVCDDIRMENTGKEILIGVYTSGINFVGQPPGRLIKLCFRLDVDDVDNQKVHEFRFELRAPSKSTLVGVDGQLKVATYGRGIIHLPQAALQLYEKGLYTMHAGFGGSLEIVDSIEVNFVAADNLPDFMGGIVNG